MKRFFYFNFFIIAMILFCTHGTVLAQTQVSYDEFCKPTVTGHPNGSAGNKRWQTNGDIVSNTNLVADSPLSFSPIGSKTGQNWSNTDNEIKAYPGATFNLKITYGIDNNDDGWGTLTIFQLRSDQPDNKNMLGQYLGDWGVQDGNNIYSSLQNQKEDSNGFIVDVNATEKSATFKIDVPDNITPGELTIVRFIVCKKYDAANLNTPIGNCTNKYDEDPCSTDAIELNYCDYIIRIVEPENISKTVTVNSNGNGSARIISPEGESNNYITTDQAVTVQAFPENGYKFVNWTDQDNNIISTSNPYIHYEAGVITLTANFEEGKYPEMKRFFHATENNQHNRYLDKVTYTINGSENIVFEATTKEQLPYTAMPSPHGTATTVGALIDKTATKIALPQGTTSFDMKFRTYNSNIIEGTATCKPEIVWTKQAYYIDFNNDFNFAGATDGINEISGAAGYPSSNNNFGDDNGSIANGWTRTITLPESLQPGTYRMRVVYYENSDYNNDNWTTTLFTTLNGEIRSGISYDFDIVIQSLETTRTVTVNANPAEGGSVKITSPADITGSIVETSEPVTVVAEANPGYRFINWTNGQGVSVSTTQEYTYSGMVDITLNANFEKLTNRVIETQKGSLNSHGQFNAGYIVRGNIPIGIIDGANSITMAAWVNIEGPSSNSIDQGSVAWGHEENMGKVVIGTRQNNLTGYGSEPAFAINVCGIDDTKDVYKLGLFAKGGAKNISGVEMPKGWFHLAFTLNYDNTNTTIKMFVNGVEKAEASKSGNFERFDDLCVGDNMNAEFDDIMIWNTALDANAIAASMKGYTDEEIKGQTNLIGYYTCDDLTDNNAVSNNLVTNYSEFTLRRDKMSYAFSVPKWATPCTKSDYTGTEVAVLSERQTPRGGEKFFDGESDATWLTNGNETNFGYIVKTNNITHLAYNGVDKVALDNDVLAVYHNGNPALPTFVRQSDIITNAELEVPQIQSSYVAAGLEYTITMPSVAKQWMPISLPGQVDLVAGPTSSDHNTLVGLRPGWNFWYSTFNSKYADETNYSDIWSDIEKDTDEETSKVYLLDAGIISVPDSRKGQQFTFYTEYNTPVVMRAWNDQFNSTLMPEPGKLGLVKNPYSFKVTVTDIAKQIGANMTVYVYNPKSGNFDIPQEGTQFIVDRFVPFFVFNGNGTTQKAPRYIGTKDVSGVLEVEAVYDVNVSGTQGAIEIKTFVPTEIEIFTINGTLVAASEVNGTHSFTLEAGIYIVRTIVEGNAKTFKVIVE